MLDDSDTPLEDEYSVYVSMCKALQLRCLPITDNWLEHMLDLEFLDLDFDDWTYND